MSKYVKELMMEGLKAELGETRSVLIVDLKGLDAVSENRLRLDLRKRKIRLRALKNSLARRVFESLGMQGLDPLLSGASVAVWGGEGIAELAKEVADQVKKLKKPQIKGGTVDGVLVGPAQIDEITKLPSREALIARVAGLAIAPAQRVLALANAPAAGLASQIRSRAGSDSETAAPDPAA